MSRRQLDLYVLNQGVGETQIIHLPNDTWGVVDCYASSPTDPGKHRIIQFLQERGVKQLAFVCLTHPHHDHYRGMLKLLETIGTDRFWRFSAFTGVEFRSFARYKEALASHVYKRQLKPQSNPELMEDSPADARELTQILMWGHKTHAERDQRDPVWRYQHVSGYQELLHGADAGHVSWVIRSLAPTGNRAGRYQQQLAGQFEIADNGRHYLKEDATFVGHNAVSVALILEYGRHRILLGGDVEDSTWSEVEATPPTWGLHANLVKVSHHGSDAGMPESLWKTMGAGGLPWSVVTPYKRHHLPTASGLVRLRRHASRVFTTSKRCTFPADATNVVQFPDNASADEREWITAHMHSLRRLDQLAGTCHFEFPVDGPMRSRCEGGACDLTQQPLPESTK